MKIDYEAVREALKQGLAEEPEYNLWEWACEMVDDLPDEKLEYYLKFVVGKTLANFIKAKK